MEAPVKTAEDTFSYAEFCSRNLGFVSAEEQALIRDGSVFVCGVGGMGGACVESLARAGVGRLAIADFDTFEVSNFNRQPFADLDTVGMSKTAATAKGLLRINPGLQLEVLDERWCDQLDQLLPRYRVVINGMDDVRASIHLYRKAAEHGVVVIDAYSAPLPSVTVVRPQDPRPEARLGYPSPGRDWQKLSDADVALCVQRELEHVMIHSTSARHVVMQHALEMLRGERKRMSFAPMVLTTGNMMCFEALALLMGRPSGTDCRGYFFNPWQSRVERPRTLPGRWLVGMLVRRYLRSLAT
jgi:molybdopterin-synthase adenylyltransferase